MSLRLWLQVQIMGPKRYSCGIFLGHGCNVKVSARVTNAVNKLLISFYWFILHLWFVVQGATHVPHIMSVWESIKDRGQLWNYSTCFWLSLLDGLSAVNKQYPMSMFISSPDSAHHTYITLSYSLVSIKHNQVDLILCSYRNRVCFNISI